MIHESSEIKMSHLFDLIEKILDNYKIKLNKHTEYISGYQGALTGKPQNETYEIEFIKKERKDNE